MLPICLLNEEVVRCDGTSPLIDVARHSGKLMVLTLSITCTIEQASLQVSVWGSPDGSTWGVKPLASFPQKSYCGLYSTLLNLSQDSNLRYIRFQWKVNRWAKNPAPPLFVFSIDAQESGTRVRVHTVSEEAVVAVA